MPGSYLDKVEELINQSDNEKKSSNSKLIERLLLIVTITNLEWLTCRSKLVIYTGVFVKLYNLKNCEQIHEIYGIIELEKIFALTTKNLCKLNVH